MEEIWFKIDGFQFTSTDYDYDYIRAKSIWYKATKHMLEKAWNFKRKTSVAMIIESMTAQALHRC